jgi:hypothetical protein
MRSAPWHGVLTVGGGVGTHQLYNIIIKLGPFLECDRIEPLCVWRRVGIVITTIPGDPYYTNGIAL